MSIQNQKNNHNFHQIIALEDSIRGKHFVSFYLSRPPGTTAGASKKRKEVLSGFHFRAVTHGCLPCVSGVHSVFGFARVCSPNLSTSLHISSDLFGCLQAADKAKRILEDQRFQADVYGDVQSLCNAAGQTKTKREGRDVP